MFFIFKNMHVHYLIFYYIFIIKFNFTFFSLHKMK